jgi:hypothetical protein
VPEIGAFPRDAYGLQGREGRDLITMIRSNSGLFQVSSSVHPFYRYDREVAATFAPTEPIDCERCC